MYFSNATCLEHLWMYFGLLHVSLALHVQPGDRQIVYDIITLKAYDRETVGKMMPRFHTLHQSQLTTDILLYVLAHFILYQFLAPCLSLYLKIQTYAMVCTICVKY